MFQIKVLLFSRGNILREVNHLFWFLIFFVVLLYKINYANLIFKQKSAFRAVPEPTTSHPSDVMPYYGKAICVLGKTDQLCATTEITKNEFETFQSTRRSSPFQQVLAKNGKNENVITFHCFKCHLFCIIMFYYMSLFQNNHHSQKKT